MRTNLEPTNAATYLRNNVSSGKLPILSILCLIQPLIKPLLFRAIKLKKTRITNLSLNNKINIINYIS